MENKYTLKIALVVLTILIALFAYTSYHAYRDSPEWRAIEMRHAQELLIAKITEDQAQMAEEAKALIADMDRKKKEQEKIYQAYLSGAKMDQRELSRIQDRLKNLEYCEAMMSYECFSTSTASGAPVSSAPSHRYSLITTTYASDIPDSARYDTAITPAMSDPHTELPERKANGKIISVASPDDELDRTPAKGKGDSQPSPEMSQLDPDASLTPQGQATHTTARSQALEMIREYEGLRLTAYPDGYGYSIGYGSRSYEGEKISKQEAERRLQYLVDRLITKIRKDYPKSSDNKIAALTSLRYNCERCYQRITARVKAGKAYIEYWEQGAGGRQLKGLLKRRAEEVALFLKI